MMTNNSGAQMLDELWEHSKQMAARIVVDNCREYLRNKWNRRKESAEFDAAETLIFIEQAHQDFCSGLALDNPTWQAQLTAKVYELLQERPAASDAAAFFTFRLPGWRNKLDAALERSYNLWLERRDYSEFLRLVRPHLLASTGRVLQLMFWGGEWCFYDVSGQRLSLAELEAGAGWELADLLGLEHDESLIRILLNYAPEKLLLHLGPGEMPPLGSIVSDLLGSRLVCCSGCEFCREKHQPPLSL